MTFAAVHNYGFIFGFKFFKVSLKFLAAHIYECILVPKVRAEKTYKILVYKYDHYFKFCSIRVFDSRNSIIFPYTFLTIDYQIKFLRTTSLTYLACLIRANNSTNCNLLKLCSTIDKKGTVD